jgi:four helix bundle protein
MKLESGKDNKGGYGHRKMVVWQNIDRIDILVQDILKRIPRTEFKLRSQIDNASDSVGANFVEGYYSGSLAEYLRFLRYSKRSLAELQERVRRTWRKGYVKENLPPSPNLSPLGRGNAEQRLLPSPNLSPLGRGNGEGAINLRLKRSI